MSFNLFAENMNNDLATAFDVFSKEVEKKIRCVVKVTTSQWGDKNGMYEKKSLKFLKRKCSVYNFVEDDCQMVGANEVFSRITNLKECKDGIYEVVTCNEHKDYWTGHIEDWDYKLIPFEEENEHN